MYVNVLSQLNDFVYYFANPVIGLLTLAGLVKIWITTKNPPSVKFIKLAIILNVLTTILRSIYSTVVNYIMWNSNPATQKLLELKYVIKFSFNTYWLVTLITLTFAFLFFKLLFYINKRFNERFFYTEELYLISLGIILNPWPMLLFFVLSSIFCLLLIQIINLIIQQLNFKDIDSENTDLKNINLKNKKIEFERISMIHIWIPAMLLSMLIYFSIFSNLFPYIKFFLLNNWFFKQLLSNLVIF